MSTYRDLEAWQAGMTLVESIYAISRHFPREEVFGLMSQIRRAAVSIPLNVAEGASRRRTRAFANHVSIALGSHAEVETCLELAVRLKYIPQAMVAETAGALARTGQLLTGLFRSLHARVPR